MGTTIEKISKLIRDVPDFPKKGILFKDITPLLKDADAYSKMIGLLVEKYQDKKIDYVAGIESRGFIFGTSLAAALFCGFIPIRKPGKLPYYTFSEEYALEYGSDKLEIHQDAVEKGSRVLIVDDLLATGGTAAAAVKLVEKCDGTVVAIQFIIELEFLKGIEKIEGYHVDSLITY